jgi:hypothetical protein
MLVLSICLFVLAAVIGLTLAVMLFKKKETPKPVVVVHGLVAGSGLVLLFLHTLKNPHSLLYVAIGLFVLAALGGVILFANDLRRRPGPLFLVVIHATAAVVALSLVLIAAYA